MATQSKKKSTGKRSQTAKKGNSSGKKTTKSNNTKSNNARNNTKKNNSKETQGPDLLTMVVVVIAVILVVVLISKYKKEQEGKEPVNPTGTVLATGTPEVIITEPVKDTDAPKPTAAGKATPTPEPTLAPTPTEVPVLSLVEATEIVNRIVQLEKYVVELLDDHLIIDGIEYYSFCINDEKGNSLEPLLIVEKVKGTLLCYDLSGVVAPIEKFPLDKTETGSGDAKTLTEEEAKKILLGYSKERLGLANETASYEVEADAWTTMAEGVECYGINFFETVDGKQKFRGTFYVALDGSVVYSQDDETGVFIKR